MSEIVKALAVTLEALGQEWGKETIKIVSKKLEAYSIEDVEAALSRCMDECRGKLTVSDILDRMPNGHPGPDEAWGICGPTLTDESRSVAWTDEMREAMGLAYALQDNAIAARKAFQEKYKELVAQARSARQKPNWTFSPGTDKNDRVRVLTEAARQGRIASEWAVKQLPPGEGIPAALLPMIEKTVKQIGVRKER